MKNRICILLAALLLFSGCSPADTAARPAQAATPQPAATPDAPQREPVSPVPAKDRKYYEPDGKYGGVSGPAYAGPQELNMLSITLRLKNWKSLAAVLEAFGWYMQDACVNDVRMIDLAAYDGPDTRFDIAMPQYDEESGVAYIELRTGDYQRGMRYVLVFHKNSEGLYAMGSVVTLDEEYYDGSPSFAFKKMGQKIYLIWDGLWGHGTGFEDYAQEWYDTDTGRRVYAYDTYGYEADWPPVNLNADTWEAAVSHDAVPIGNEWDYYLPARESRRFTFTDGAPEEVYACEYRVYYDVKQNLFYTARDALLPLYEQAARSPTAYVREWAQRRMEALDPAHAEAPPLPPALAARCALPSTGCRIEELPLGGGNLSEERLRAFRDALCAIKTGGYKEMEAILSFFEMRGYNYNRMEAGALKGSVLDGMSNISCTLDMESCKERVVFLHLQYDRAKKRRGATFAYVLGDEDDRWSLYRTYVYPLSGESVEAAWLLDYAGYSLKLPVGRANGHTVYESVVHNASLVQGLKFISEYHDKKGDRHTLTFSRAYAQDAAGLLRAAQYPAGSDTTSHTAYVEIWTDWWWQDNAPFVDMAEYPEIERFFAYGA